MAWVTLLVLYNGVRRWQAPERVFDELQDLQEVEAMLAERVKEWAEEWKQQGLQEGIQEGLQQGEAAIVLRLLERRFGALDETVAAKRNPGPCWMGSSDLSRGITPRGGQWFYGPIR